MPYLKIQTNQAIDAERNKRLLSQASQSLAKALGKPERYIMVESAAAASMLFAGSDEPAAYVELKNIGLAESQTAPLSRLICDLLQEQLGIRADRIYIEFTDIDGKFWGWNGGTF